MIFDLIPRIDVVFMEPKYKPETTYEQMLRDQWARDLGMDQIEDEVNAQGFIFEKDKVVALFEQWTKEMHEDLTRITLGE